MARNLYLLCRDVRCLLLLATGLILSGNPYLQAAPNPPKHLTSGENIFASNHVFQIQIEIPEADVETLRGYRWNGFRGGTQPRPSVKVTVREGNTTYKDVALHLKGAAGSFRSIDDRPAMTLNFDKHVKGQTFHGIERFSLNNSVQDRSLLNEQFSREMFAIAGVPVPRATHAKVQLNGRDLGLYVLVEAFNKQFLARHFKSPNGNLYDGGFLKDITDELSKSSGKGPDDRSDLKALAEAAMEPNPTNRMARLEKVLDVDRFISYMALDIMMCDWDGYALNQNNYRIYHDIDRGKIVFMPHGLDQMFGVMRAGTDMPLFPRMKGLVARQIMTTPDGRRQYRDKIAQFSTNLFRIENMTNRVWEMAAKLRPILSKEGAGAVRSYEAEVREFCERIVARTHDIQQQLAAPDKALKFDALGMARFDNWQPKIVFGKPVLNQSNEGGRKVLHVSANGSSVGIWTTRVRLEPGAYRLEAKVKARGITPDPGDRRGGAGLRISDRRFNQKLVGDSDWKDLVFDFDLQPASSAFNFMAPIEHELPDIELICELRAAKGEAWFDLDSIRLIRK